MNSGAFPRGPAHLVQKGVQVRLRGGGSLRGLIHIPDGLSLLHFLGTKKFFLNLTSVRLLELDEEPTQIDHLSLRLSNVVWIIPEDGSLHVSTGVVPAGSSRTVEIQLVDDLRLTVDLNIADEQRMSDYLDANWSFLPLWAARVSSPPQAVERLALNHEAILAIREIRDS